VLIAEIMPSDPQMLCGGW